MKKLNIILESIVAILGLIGMFMGLCDQEVCSILFFGFLFLSAKVTLANMKEDDK